MTSLSQYRAWRSILATYLAFLALIGFWPSPVDKPVQGTLSEILAWLHAHRIPHWFNYQFVEASANVLLFVPMGFAAALAFRENRWWQNALLGLLASSCMELGQSLFLDHRFASPLDLVTNTLGAVIGVVLAAASSGNPSSRTSGPPRTPAVRRRW
ncbi:VanZ family protein [Pseudarthrobacter sp. N5]|uniref:VanZ family protein n=1 Tax=Pseudarthrobacter sp. N5 TaxID=3418416 RepID=UPI003CE7A1B1